MKVWPIICAGTKWGYGAGDTLLKDCRKPFFLELHAGEQLQFPQKSNLIDPCEKIDGIAGTKTA
jgi:hypothetical protein